MLGSGDAVEGLVQGGSEGSAGSRMDVDCLDKGEQRGELLEEGMQLERQRRSSVDVDLSLQENFEENSGEKTLLFENAKASLKEKNFEEAIRKFTSLISSISPESVLLEPNLPISLSYMGRGRSWQLLGQNVKAIEDYSSALKYATKDTIDDKKRSRIYTLRASCYVSIKRADLALKDYEAAIILNDNDSSIYTGKANLYMLMQQFEPALQNVHIALKKDPNNALAHQHMGMVYAQLNQMSEAIGAFNRSLSLKEHYETYILRGKAYSSVGDTTHALEDFSSAIALFPQLPLAYGNRAALYAQMKRLDLAVEDAGTWIARSSTKEAISARQARGVWFALMGKYSESVEDFSEVLKIDNRHVLAYSSRATAYSHMKMHDKAISDWMAVVKIQPSWPKPYWNIGNELVSKRDFANAIKYFSEAVRLEPSNPITFQQRAHAFSQVGLHDRAVLDLSHAVRIDARNPSLYQDRSYEYLQLKEFARALSDLNSAIHLSPLDPVNYEKRAAAMWKMNCSKFGRTDVLQAKRLRLRMANQVSSSKSPTPQKSSSPAAFQAFSSPNNSALSGFTASRAGFGSPGGILPQKFPSSMASVARRISPSTPAHSQPSAVLTSVPLQNSL